MTNTEEKKARIRPSTIAERRALRNLIDETAAEIRRLVSEGHEVTLILDVDHVLIDGRSDDIFELLDHDLSGYFAYEERLLLQVANEGPWTTLARRCGEPGFQQTQVVVTARSTYTSFRALQFTLHRGIPIAYHYSVGSQSKAESYRLVLEAAFREGRKSFVFMVDDGERHCRDFERVAEEMGVTENSKAILSPRIRHYDFAQLQAHYQAVMDPERTSLFHLHEGSIPGIRGPRYTFLVAPRGRLELRDMLEGMMEDARREAIVSGCREQLEKIAKQQVPQETVTTELLYEIWQLLQGP